MDTFVVVLRATREIVAELQAINRRAAWETWWKEHQDMKRVDYTVEQKELFHG